MGKGAITCACIFIKEFTLPLQYLRLATVAVDMVAQEVTILLTFLPLVSQDMGLRIARSDQVFFFCSKEKALYQSQPHEILPIILLALPKV